MLVITKIIISIICVIIINFAAINFTSESTSHPITNQFTKYNQIKKHYNFGKNLHNSINSFILSS